MRNYLWTIIGLGILFSASLDAQCRRGEQLRITNDVEEPNEPSDYFKRVFKTKDSVI